MNGRFRLVFNLLDPKSQGLWMVIRKLPLFLALMLFFSAGTLLSNEAEPVKLNVYSEYEEIAPGSELSLLFEAELAPTWHIYGKNPGDLGVPTTFDFNLPEGVTLKEILFSPVTRFDTSGIVTFGYEEKALFSVNLAIDPSFKGENELKLTGSMNFVSCSEDTCLPGSVPFETSVKIGALKKSSFADKFQSFREKLKDSGEDDVAYLEQGKVLQANHSDETEESIGLLSALLFAFLGGLLLNLMPCVLPVVSLKILSFVKLAGSSRVETAKHGLFFTAGVLLSFLSLAVSLLVLQSVGQAVGWGFQLQDPFFIALMTFLFFILSLNLFGVFEIGTSLVGLAGEAERKNRNSGYSQSFFSGIFATAVATPCTGPFMGTALGFAISQPAIVSLSIFTMLGLGMSFPYILIGFFPNLIKFLPKPGAWMESFKQFLGFIMICSVIWLLWVFTGQTSEKSLFVLLFSLWVVSVGAWIYGKFGTIASKKSLRKASYLISALCLAVALYLTWQAIPNDEVKEIGSEKVAEGDWEPFSKERLVALRAEGRPVLIDFTAKWCLVCQANHMILTQNEVENKMSEKGVVKMKADWTRYDADITNELQKHGRNGVPLYVLYGDEEKPKILPQLLTKDTLISSIEENVGPIVR